MEKREEEYVINPHTNRRIRVGGPTYKRLYGKNLSKIPSNLKRVSPPKHKKKVAKQTKTTKAVKAKKTKAATTKKTKTVKAVKAVKKVKEITNKKGVLEEVKKSYFILKKIGEGSFGMVYKIQDKQSRKIYALKTYQFFEKHEKYGMPSDALVEIDILSRVSHPNVLSLSNIFMAHCEANISLEYANSTLYDVISKKTISKDILVDWMFQLLCGVQYLHVNYIIHQDLKPENILVYDQNILKIADFGIASIFPSAANIPYMGIQSFLYRAPEILESQPTYSNKVDIWSLGVIFLNMITGILRPPIMHEMTIGVSMIKSYQTMADTIEDPAQRSIVKQCLEVDPRKRASASALLGNFSKTCVTPTIQYVDVEIRPNSVYMQQRATILKQLRDIIQSDKRLTLDLWFLVVDLLDRFFTKKQTVTQNKVEVFVLAALWIGSKLYPPELLLDEILSLGKISKKTLIDAECEIVETLEYKLYRPTINLLFPTSKNLTFDSYYQCMLTNVHYMDIKECLSL